MRQGKGKGEGKGELEEGGGYDGGVSVSPRDVVHRCQHCCLEGGKSGQVQLYTSFFLSISTPSTQAHHHTRPLPLLGKH